MKVFVKYEDLSFLIRSYIITSSEAKAHLPLRNHTLEEEKGPDQGEQTGAAISIWDSFLTQGMLVHNAHQASFLCICALHV